MLLSATPDSEVRCFHRARFVDDHSFKNSRPCRLSSVTSTTPRIRSQNRCSSSTGCSRIVKQRQQKYTTKSSVRVILVFCVLSFINFSALDQTCDLSHTQDSKCCANAIGVFFFFVLLFLQLCRSTGLVVHETPLIYHDCSCELSSCGLLVSAHSVCGHIRVRICDRVRMCLCVSCVMYERNQHIECERKNPRGWWCAEICRINFVVKKHCLSFYISVYQPTSRVLTCTTPFHSGLKVCVLYLLQFLFLLLLCSFFSTLCFLGCDFYLHHPSGRST